ncbi:hypothetical protein B0B48_03765 [Lactobacillus gasseri]|uniref:hypothetical protein n=1 Tax=Lactobacillus gasseri TaxID=1596 RepID=UPI000985F17E|nr:hypothetical protein [Lactobacillus gasseri]OOK86927.1 hypothetical protein B0B48_03765 [Lactobacillus gasseri]UYP71296.1 hypothetical protein OF126_03080 [Lactobacillus gasseri]
MKNIIYFTKEDGNNRLLFTSNNRSTNWRGAISKLGLKKAEKQLGHKPTNIYMLVDGCEIKLI